MGKKVDLTINKSISLSMGNYNTIKPTVGLTVKDIDSDDLGKEYKKATSYTDALLAREILSLSDEVLSADRIGILKYISALENSITKLDEIIKNYGKE